jgi:hypothetical protein
MPCRDWDESTRIQVVADHEKEARLQREIDFLEAALCGLIRSLPITGFVTRKYPFERVNFKEAGIRRGQLQTWWEQHQIRDNRKVHEEMAEEARKKLRKKALAKLTPRERKLLGVKKT